MKHKLSFFLLILTVCFYGCSIESDDSDPNISMEAIKGRDNDGDRFPVYRVRVPQQWVRRDPLPDESIVDTTKSICEYIIKDEDEVIRIAVHNFPSENIQDRVPPGAQLARWQRQFQTLDQNSLHITPQAYNGYSGLRLFAAGMIKDKEVMVMGWSLQLAPDYYQTLSVSHTHPLKSLYRQMGADVTIKAVGPPLLMEKYKKDICSFALSFELIEELPSRS